MACSVKRFGTDCGIVDKKKRLLGKGDYGEVYSAGNKVYKKVLGLDADYAYSCVVNHPNIIKYDRVITSNDCDLADNAMQLFISDKLSNDTKEYGEFMLKGLLQGYAALASINIVHYDIFEKNVLRKGRQGVVADLGGCRVTDGIHENLNFPATFTYLPPSIIYTPNQEYVVGEFTSVYSFAVLCAKFFLGEINYKRSHTLHGTSFKIHIKKKDFIDSHLSAFEASAKSKNKITRYLSEICLEVLQNYKETDDPDLFTTLPSYKEIMQDLGIKPTKFKINPPDLSCITENDYYLKRYVKHMTKVINNNQEIEEILIWFLGVCLAILIFKGIKMEYEDVLQLGRLITYTAFERGDYKLIDKRLATYFISNLDGMLLPITGYHFGKDLNEVLNPYLWREYYK